MSAASATLTLADLAARWRVSVRQVRRWVREGKLRVHRLGHRTVRVAERDAEEFWSSCREEPPPPPRVSPLRPLSSNPVEDAILRRRREKKGARS